MSTDSLQQNENKNYINGQTFLRNFTLPHHLISLTTTSSFFIYNGNFGKDTKLPIIARSVTSMVKKQDSNIWILKTQEVFTVVYYWTKKVTPYQETFCIHPTAL